MQQPFPVQVIWARYLIDVFKFVGAYVLPVAPLIFVQTVPFGLDCQLIVQVPVPPDGVAFKEIEAPVQTTGVVVVIDIVGSATTVMLLVTLVTPQPTVV